jgi:hypothetical protein
VSSVGALVLASIALTSCGSDAPSTAPTPIPSHWEEAAIIDGAPPATGNCSPAQSPQVATDGAGGAVAVWLMECSVWAAGYTPSQGWTTPVVIGQAPADSPTPNWLSEPVLATNAIGGVVALWATQGQSGQPQLWARRWAATSSWAAAERIDGSQTRVLSIYDVPVAAVAMDRDGNVVALWRSEGIVSARFTAGHGWDAPERLTGREVISNPAVAFDSTGRALGAWGEPGAATVRWLDPLSGWSSPSRFFDTDWAYFYAPVLAFAGPGRAVVLWDRVEPQREPLVSSVWSASFDGQQWRALGQLSAPGVDAGGSRIGADSQGRTLGLWADPQRVLSSQLDPTAGWETPQTVTTVGGPGPRAFAVAPSGVAFATWQYFDALVRHDRTVVSRFTGGRWEPAEPLHSATTWPMTPALAVDSCGNAVAVWAEQEGERTRVWARRYAAGCR